MKEDLLKGIVEYAQETGVIKITENPTPEEIKQHVLSLSMYIGCLVFLVA